MDIIDRHFAAENAHDVAATLETYVDGAIVTGRAQGSFLGVDGGGAPVRFRMLHVFDLRDGLIAREQAWFDTADVLRQIESHRGAVADTAGSR